MVEPVVGAGVANVQLVDTELLLPENVIVGEHNAPGLSVRILEKARKQLSEYVKNLRCRSHEDTEAAEHGKELGRSGDKLPWPRDMLEE